MSKEELLLALSGKTDNEKREFLSQRFNLDWVIPEGPCKIWFARVFTYCTTSQLENELNFFFFLVNTFGYLWRICFKEEDTVFIGCTCPCGNKQIILYYSLTLGD